ncbi:MAG TPA: hypothetical protein VMC02_15425 [Steroidobacteraceae bacterium]|nr:hypothetical protein [Steroidobacteraceae bacterium]
MVDLTSANPLVMTHFELIAAVTATCVLLIAVATDLWHAYRSRSRRLD